MIDAILLFSGATVYGPWFSRNADMLRVAAECVARNGATLVVDLVTKDADDTGDGTDVDTGTDITLNTPGMVTGEWRSKAGQAGVEHLLRFRYTVTGANATDWILFRMLPPCWFDAVQEP